MVATIAIVLAVKCLLLFKIKKIIRDYNFCFTHHKYLFYKILIRILQQILYIYKKKPAQNLELGETKNGQITMDDDFNEYGNFDDPYGDLFQDLDENSLRIEEYTMESFYGGNG